MKKVSYLQTLNKFRRGTPYISETDSIIVLCSEDSEKLEGICISSNSNIHIGYFSKYWASSKFEEFKGTILLEN